MASSTSALNHGSMAEEEHLINEDDKGEIVDKAFYPHRRQWLPTPRSSLISLVVITAFTSTILSGLGLHFLHVFNTQQHQQSSAPNPGTRFGSCGDTPSSAREANCTFDIMSFSWLPTPCADPKLTAEFLAVRNWTWWLDTDTTVPVPFDEVAMGNHRELFVTREYHMYHCTYMWRKLHRGLLEGQHNAEGRGVVDTYIGEYSHTAHCEMMILGTEGDEDTVNKTATDTAILMKFPQCMWT